MRKTSMVGARHAVNRDIRAGAETESLGCLARGLAVHGPATASIADGLVELPHGGLPIVGKVLFEVIAYVLQARCGGGRPFPLLQ